MTSISAERVETARDARAPHLDSIIDQIEELLRTQENRVAHLRVESCIEGTFLRRYDANGRPDLDELNRTLSTMLLMKHERCIKLSSVILNGRILFTIQRA